MIVDQFSIKFQAIILDKKKNNHPQEITKIDNEAVIVKSSVKLLGVQTDAELNLLTVLANMQRINSTLLLGLESSQVLKRKWF